MTFGEALRSRFTAGIIAGGLVAYALGVLSAGAYFQRRQVQKTLRS